MGYVIGAVAFEQLGKPILDALGKSDSVQEFAVRFNDVGFWKRVALTRAFDKGTGELWDPRANFYTSLAT